MSDDRLDELDEAQRGLALRLRESLRASERLDAATTVRLAQARVRAVDSGRARVRPAWLWASGGITAAALVAALVLLLPLGGPQRGTTDAGATSSVDAIDVLTDDLDADFYEDLELYRWLAEDGRA